MRDFTNGDVSNFITYICIHMFYNSQYGNYVKEHVSYSL